MLVILSWITKVSDYNTFEHISCATVRHWTACISKGFRVIKGEGEREREKETIMKVTRLRRWGSFLPIPAATGRECHEEVYPIVPVGTG